MKRTATGSMRARSAIAGLAAALLVLPSLSIQAARGSETDRPAIQDPPAAANPAGQEQAEEFIPDRTDRFSRRVQFGRFGAGLRPEDMEISEIEGELANELTYEEMVACIRQEIEIRVKREEFEHVTTEATALGKDLDRISMAISNDRMNVKGSRATPERVREANGRIARYNTMTGKANLLADLHDALRARLDGLLVEFNVGCVGRPFDLDVEMEARAEVTGRNAGQPRLAIRNGDEKWPDLSPDRR